MKSVKATVDQTEKVVSFPGKHQHAFKEELAFLPAALEIVETPPSPLGQAIGATIIILFCIALTWASLGHIDMVATATGKIVPDGQIKVLQPFETGIIRAIHVHDGQSVKAGEVLIELDPTMTAAEQAHIQSDLTAAQLDAARLRAELSDGEDPEAAFVPPADASPELVATQRRYLSKELEEYRAKLASFDRQRLQKEAAAGAVLATIDKLESTGPLIDQRVQILKELTEKQLGSKLTFLEALQAQADNAGEAAIQRTHLQEAEAAIASVIETSAQETAEFRKKLFSELTEAERKAAGLSGDLVKAQQRTKLQALTAPVDGTVQQLAIHTVGGVVTPAQQLAIVVPSGTSLEVEATIANKDVGFVHAGQDVEIKIDTFNFTRYGMIHGRLLSVSQDSIAHDVSSDNSKASQGANRSTSEPRGQELSYAARVALDQSQIEVDGKPAFLTPGMAVTTEIKTGSQSILGYLLLPLLRYRQEALHER